VTTDDVLVIEDHPVLAQTLVAALGSRSIHAIVAPSTAEADVLAMAVAGTLAILDLQLADGQDGSLLVAPLRRAGAEVLVLTGSRDLEAIGRALDYGAVEVIDKASPFEQVLAAVTSALDGTGPLDTAGRTALERAVRTWRSEHARATAVLDRLTPREQQVLDELCRGRAVDEIAASARVSLTTVRSQVAAVLTKLGVHSQLTAVARARELQALVASRGQAYHPAAHR
jgi:DNA-binding NarL/FixJ family response regulator